jgi:hypothetical protein
MLVNMQDGRAVLHPATNIDLIRTRVKNIRHISRNDAHVLNYFELISCGPLLYKVRSQCALPHLRLVYL